MLGGKAAKQYRAARDTFVKSIPLPPDTVQINVDTLEFPLDERAAIELAFAKPMGSA